MKTYEKAMDVSSIKQKRTKSIFCNGKPIVPLLRVLTESTIVREAVFVSLRG